MHNCEEFRERITEHIIDREDISAKPEFKRELLICSGCSEFYSESREMMDALAEVDLTVSESQWWGIERRLQQTLRHAQPEAPLRSRVSPFFEVQKSLQRATTRFFPVVATIAALLIITAGLGRLAKPTDPQRATPGNQSRSAVYVEHSVPLDPVTVDFLEESELLLRNVMKIAAADIDDLADAKKTADQQLAQLGQRKEAAADVPPVVHVMETYETVLRDLRNIDEQNADEDISDIQKRIQTNGLIASMKAFQPRVTELSFGGLR